MIKQITRQLFSFLLLLCALSATAQEPEAIATNPSSIAAEDQTETPTDTQVETIPVEPRTTALEKFAETFDESQWIPLADEKMLSLYRPDSSGSAQGALLIVHRGEEPPWWNQALEHMRQTLPDHGWATLLIVLPTQREEIPARPAEKPKPPASETNTAATDSDTPASTDTADTAAEGEDEEIFDSSTGELATTEEMNRAEEAQTAAPKVSQRPLSERNEERLMAALGFLHEKNQFNLALLSDSSSAPKATEVFLKMSPSGDSKALAAQIILNFRRDRPQSNDEIAAGLFDPAVPLLDIYIDDDKNTLRSARERLRSARRQKYRIFQQVNIDSVPQEPLAKRVRGFLTKHAQGMEMGK